MNFGEHQQGWTYTSAIYGLLCAVPLMITGYFVKERNVANKQYKDVKRKKRIPFILIIKSLITEKYFLLLLCCIYYGI